MSSILYEFTPTELQYLLDTSNSYSDILRKIGLNPKGRNPDTLKKVINEYKLDETQLNLNRTNLYAKCARDAHKIITYELEDILNGKYPKYQSSKLLRRLVESGLKNNKCEICGITEWNGNPITFQLHHINGIHEDNSLNNLMVVCPNCHSQTNSYSGKSSRRKEKDRKGTVRKVKQRIKKTPPIDRELLKEKIRNNSFVSIAEEYGLSDNAIRKWCDKYHLPRHKKAIQSYSDDEWENI